MEPRLRSIFRTDRARRGPAILSSFAFLLLIGVACSDSTDTSAPGNAASAPSHSSLDPIRDLMQDGRFSEAADRARALVIELERTYGTKSLQVAAAVELQAEAMMRAGKADGPECLRLAHRSVRIKESKLDPNHVDLASSLCTLSNIYRERGQLMESQRHVERALQITQEAFGEDDPRTLPYVQTLAGLYSEMGLHQEARSMLERALAILEKDVGEEYGDLVPTLYNLARILKRTGEYDEARRLYERAISLAEKNYVADHPLLAYLLNGLANLCVELGEYTKARDLFDRAIESAETSLGLDHPFIPSCMNNLGYLLKNIGDYEGAERAYTEALRLHKKARRVDHRYTASTMANLAEVYQRLGRYEEAESHYQEALRIRERVLDPKHTAVAANLLALAQLYLETGQPDAARQLLERALRIQKKAFGLKHVDTGETMGALGRALDDSGELSAARPLYEQALSAFQAALGLDHPRTAPYLMNLAWLDARTGDRPAALRLALRAEAISRDQARLMAGALPERQALRYSSVRTAGLDLAFTLTAGDLGERGTGRTWDSLIRSRALVLDEMGARSRALSFEDVKIKRLAGDYARASKRQADLMVRGPDPGEPSVWRVQLDEASEERERIERELARSSATFRAGRSLRSAGLAEVREAMPAGSALVAYIQYDHWSDRSAERVTVSRRADRKRAYFGNCEVVPGYLAFIQRQGQREPIVVPLGTAAEIDSLVSAWSRATAFEIASVGGSRNEVNNYRTVGEKLRKAIWDPIALHLGDARTVFVVPDGSLHLLNLASLPVGQERFLLEEGILIHYLSAERDLVSISRQIEAGNGLLALGGAAFAEDEPFPSQETSRPDGAMGFAKRRGPGPGEDQEAGLSAMTFEPLPASATEARAIADLWSRATGAKTVENPAPDELLHPLGDAAVLLTGRGASECAVKRLAPGRRILHLATHGFFLGPDPRRSGHGSERGIGGLCPAVRNPPLLLSGLVFAGANQRQERRPEEEDGILTAQEIAAMDLSGVEWAVLSACDTGIGKVVSGEGVFGLRRSFQIAGAQTLIMSLWPVEDEAAREWMEALYEARLLERMSTIESVRHASMEVLRRCRSGREGDHPFYWAGFVASGNWK